MFELIYTSYPRGLQSGTSGFTSVAYTEGMPKSYIQLCESLSGYQFIYPVGHPLYKQNPEIYSHYSFKASRDYALKPTTDYSAKAPKDAISILSRVAVSGRDYTGRENKIAHHIVLESNERVNLEGGPASLMLDKNLFVEEWSQNPCTLSKDRLQQAVAAVQNAAAHIQQPDAAAEISQDYKKFQVSHWSNIFGNAEPALMVARSAEHDLKTPSFILFNPENGGTSYKKQWLHLVAEALNLVAPEKRWDITFNTYFISKPVDSDCLWRFCPTVTRNLHVSSIDYAVSLIQKYPDSLVIDLVTKTVHGRVVENRESEKPEEQNSTESLSASEADIGIESGKGLEQRTLPEKNSLKSLSGSRKRVLWILVSIICATGVLFLYILFSNNTSPNDADLSMDETLGDKAIQDTKAGHELNSTLVVQTETVNVKSKTDKKMVLGFYEDRDNMLTQITANTSDLENMRCRLVKIDGTEIDAEIDPPITNDTPDWDIIVKGAREPAGAVSAKKLSLYNKNLYSVIYLDLPSRGYVDLIWVSPLCIDESMISGGIEDNTLEIRFNAKTSTLLSEVMSILSSEDLTGFIELKEKMADFEENGSEKIEDVGKQAEDKLIFYPVVSLKIDNNQNVKTFFIQLVVASDDFNSIMKKSRFKELRIDYTDKQSNRIYPVFSLNCK